VNRSASAGEIARAYRKLRAEMTAAATPPDNRQAALVHEAHEVLADPSRRAAYDASLRDASFLRPKRRIAAAPKWGLIAAAAAAVLLGGFFLLRPSGKPGASIPQEIVAAVSPAVGRVHSIDMQGTSNALGQAFAIEAGVMVTTCHGFAPNTQLLVSFGSRKAPAQIARPDAGRNLCKLAVADTGSWPLVLEPREPQPGSKVFAASTNAAGEAVIVEGKVTGLISAEEGRAIEINVPVTASMTGGPVLDAYGKVVGVMTSQHPFGAGRNIALPASWVSAFRTRER
jgi:S1-C subfamily serine protease